MAPVTHQNTISPNSFKFLIGPEQRPYFLRSGAVAGQSRALDALVHGSGSKEQNERSAVWTNVDEPTFLRFSQRQGLRHRRGLVFGGGGGGGGGGGRTKASSPWVNFALLFPDDGSHTRRNGPTDDYSEVFLSHARIYFLAEYYGIAELRPSPCTSSTAPSCSSRPTGSAWATSSS
ncbi:unnamed protein product [Parascedosporium putredinis]|uniref:Uncharacterized protein n=1 Tax=Parascedosporium putredinis TaxID=1442378 RepID=A0A9P1GXP5_9PEZI|nr:unnamed protein product [Parascedosporium putredinis]CAI7989259.1 unnamed protein product [Parascedosporium putredinis]